MFLVSTQLAEPLESIRNGQDQPARNYDQRRSLVSFHAGDLGLVDLRALRSSQKGMGKGGMTE